MTKSQQDTQAVPAHVVPTTMRAAVYRGVNDVRIETVPVPEIGPGEVLMKIDTCGVCGTDLKKIHSGSHDAPRIFGHEMSGTIAKVGEGVEGFAVGDRVMAYHHVPCGDCYYCRKQTFSQCEDYKRVGCTAGQTFRGAASPKYIRVMDWIVREAWSDSRRSVEQAAFVDPSTPATRRYQLRLQPDETVLVIGQGSIRSCWHHFADGRNGY